jgi:hypothetical protein
MHRRLFPVRYRFVYRVFRVLLDIDALDDLPTMMRPGRRSALVRFDPADHGPRDGSPLRPWIEGVLAGRGIDLDGGRIRLLCFPRVLGFGFNPLSLWYCEHSDGTLRAVIAEVNNTFGEHHFYLLTDGGRPMAWPLRSASTKCFHVSPLMDLHGGYRFRLSEPTDRLSIVIRQFDDQDTLQLVAAETGQGDELTNASLRQALLQMPLMTFKVVAAIHWQALKIWLRGARYFPKPEPPSQEVT